MVGGQGRKQAASQNLLRSSALGQQQRGTGSRLLRLAGDADTASPLLCSKRRVREESACDYGRGMHRLPVSLAILPQAF